MELTRNTRILLPKVFYVSIMVCRNKILQTLTKSDASHESFVQVHSSYPNFSLFQLNVEHSDRVVRVLAGIEHEIVFIRVKLEHLVVACGYSILKKT